MDSWDKRIVGLLLLCVCAVAHAADLHSFEQGLDLYGKKQYDEAAHSFILHTQTHPYDAAAWYNLGNCYAQSGDLPRSVWSYHKALQSDPGLDAAQRNLERIESRIPELVRTPRSSLSSRAASVISSWARTGVLAWTALALLYIAAALWLTLRRRNRFWAIRLGIVFSAIAMLVLAASLIIPMRQSPELVIVRGSARMYRNALGTGPVSFVAGGTRAQVKSIRQGLVQLSLPDGRTGWIAAEDGKML